MCKYLAEWVQDKVCLTRSGQNWRKWCCKHPSEQCKSCFICVCRCLICVRLKYNESDLFINYTFKIICVGPNTLITLFIWSLESLVRFVFSAVSVLLSYLLRVNSHFKSMILQFQFLLQNRLRLVELGQGNMGWLSGATQIWIEEYFYLSMSQWVHC
jgi:hypothetical protein